MLGNRKSAVLLSAIALLVIAALALPVTFSSQSAAKSVSAAVDPKSFTVTVSRYGFNGTNAPLLLELRRGDVVHITFVYGDSDLPYDNPHVIFLEGYDLRTSIVSKTNPTATLDFIATQTGTFAFYCVIPCDGMLNLSSGRVVVAGQDDTGRLPTEIDVMVDEASSEGQATSFMATLTQGGQPVAGAQVDFYANTTLGPMKIGTGLTDQNGVARVGYTFLRSGEWDIVVEFVGSEKFGPSAKRLTVNVGPGAREPILVSIIPSLSGESISTLPYVRGQNRMPDLRLVGVPLAQGVPFITMILLIVGSVWAAYGYVFAQIRAIKQGSTTEITEEKGGGERKMQSTPAKKGFDKRILFGVILLVVVLAGVFAFYQFGTTAQRKTETVKIDIKMLMQNGGERHVFDPATITVHKGDHIVLIVTNTDDDSIHGVIIPELNLNTGPLTGDQSARIEFDANATGTYTILCPVPGCAPDHAQMIGQLVVVA